MPKRYRKILIFGAVILGFLAFALYEPNPEPVYQGKKLSQWLRIFYNTQSDASRMEAEAAVRSIGTNALPHLLDWIARPRTTWRKLLQYQERTMARIQGTIHDGRIRALEPRQLGMVGFFVLRGEAGPAIPTLVELLYRTNEDAAFALGRIGSQALPALMSGLTNPSPEIRLISIRPGFSYLETNALPAVPALLLSLHHPVDDVVEVSAWALVHMELDPQVIVPALAELYQSDRVARRHLAIAALTALEQSARPALPVIIKALMDSDEELRHEATNALQAIAPEIFTNAPAQ